MGANSSRDDRLSIRSEAEIAKRYFNSFADDYHRAFHGTGQNFLHGAINFLFRRKTFSRRTDIVEQWLSAYGVRGKRVLDLGCGSGEVSMVAARLGARVTGLDIAPHMIAIAQSEASAAGFQASTTFRVSDFSAEPVPAADIVMMVGVIEYYRDVDALLRHVCDATGEALIIVDTRGPWWRRTLRYGLAALKQFHLYYHSPDLVKAIVERAGFREERRVAGHSFTALLFVRPLA